MKQRIKMNKYRGLFTFDTDNHKYIPIAQANGVIDTMGYESVPNSSEPLIKDEKIRKAVRAWAEAEEIEKVFLRDDLVWGEPMVRIAEDTAHHEISFKGSMKIKSGAYTITELCGEEEEC